MKTFFLFLTGLLLALGSAAQADTINPQSAKLRAGALKEGKASYAIYFEDSLHRRLSSADIWDRSIRFTTSPEGREVFEFEWTAWRKDTLVSKVWTTGDRKTLAPLTHRADYRARGTFSYLFTGDVVTVPESSRLTARDSAFSVTMSPAAFAFPMDLELFPLLPFKKAGQQFAMAYYEPGSPKSAYYNLTVTGRETLPLAGGASVDCWTLRIDYRPNSYATFWITDKTREVVKMQEYFSGRYRYKVRLY
jgi:hypothetical protein